MQALLLTKTHQYKTRNMLCHSWFYIEFSLFLCRTTYGNFPLWIMWRKSRKKMYMRVCSVFFFCFALMCKFIYIIILLLLSLLLTIKKETNLLKANKLVFSFFYGFYGFVPYYVRQLSAVNNGEESQERRRTCECAPYFFFCCAHIRYIYYLS